VSPLALTLLAVLAGVAAALVVWSLVQVRDPSLPQDHATATVPGGGRAPAAAHAPTDGERREFLLTLATIAPWLTEEGPIMTAADTTCQEIVRGRSHLEVLQTAKHAFIGVDDAQAGKIVEAVKVWCPGETS